MLVGCATAASFFPFVGTIIYMVLRPPEYLEDVRERELETQAAEARLRQSTRRCARIAATGSSTTSCAVRAVCASSRSGAPAARARSTRRGQSAPTARLTCLAWPAALAAPTGANRDRERAEGDRGAANRAAARRAPSRGPGPALGHRVAAAPRTHGEVRRSRRAGAARARRSSGGPAQLLSSEPHFQTHQRNPWTER